MFVGIYDYDLFNKSLAFLPSYEAMQISSFHKMNNDVVELCIKADTLDKYDKLYFVKNHIDDRFPDELLERNNVTYIGRAFTNKIGMNEEEFSSYPPDTTLYNRWYRTLPKDKIRTPTRISFNQLSSKGYYKLSTDGVNFNPYQKPIEKGLVLYDDSRVLMVDEAWQYLHDNYGQNKWNIFKFIYPLESGDLDLLLKWASLEGNYSKNTYRLIRPVTDEEFVAFCEKAHTLKVPIQFSFGDCEDSDEVYNRMNLFFKRGFYCICKGGKFEVYADHFLPDGRSLFRFFRDYFRARTFQCFDEYMVSKQKGGGKKPTAVKQYHHLLDDFPESQKYVYVRIIEHYRNGGTWDYEL